MGIRIVEIDGHWHLQGSLFKRRIRKSTRLIAEPEHLKYAEVIRQRLVDNLVASEEGRKAFDRTTRVEPRTVRDAVGDYRKASSGASDAGQGLLRDFLTEFGDRPIRKFSNRVVQEWIDRRYRTAEGTWRLKGSTIRTDVWPLTKIFRDEYARGEIARPLKLALPPQTAGRSLALTIEQVRLVLENEPPQVAPLFSFLLQTGARPIEAVPLRWEDVDLEAATVVLTHHKGKDASAKKRKVPMPPPLVEKMNALNHRNARRFGAQRQIAGFVFLNEYGRPFPSYKPTNAMWYHCNRLRKTLGLHGFTIYDFRHTYATHMVMASVELNVVSDLLGHARLDRTRKYAHLAPTRYQADVAKLPY